MSVWRIRRRDVTGGRALRVGSPRERRTRRGRDLVDGRGDLNLDAAQVGDGAG